MRWWVVAIAITAVGGGLVWIGVRWYKTTDDWREYKTFWKAKRTIKREIKEAELKRRKKEVQLEIKKLGARGNKLQTPEPAEPSDQHPAAALYQVAAHHYISGNEIVWAFLYYYFVGCSVLALAWASVFAVEKPSSPIAHDIVLVGLAVAGIVLSFIWLFLLRRSNSYRQPLREAASQVEEKLKFGTAIEGSFARAKEHGRSLGWGLGSTGFVVTAIPLLFLALFGFFLWVVLWA
ncbi:hypothetical protein MYX75_05530 [Acidobacteria bacterium AH-259-A15]|nr:hypothetical protein [Acidobacteria bacterium AH-259-A15]